MRLNKSFCVHSLWVASIILFMLRIMYVIGIPLPEAMLPLFFKILLIWSAVVLVIELLPQRSNRLEYFHFCNGASKSDIMPETMYIRSRHAFDREERYIVDLRGNIYYQIKTQRSIRNMNRIRVLDVYRGCEEKIGTVLRYRLGISELYRYTLKIWNHTYCAEIELGNEKRQYQSNTEPYIFQFNGHNGLSAYAMDKKVAETRGVFTELGYSSTDQDILFLQDPDPVLLLLLAAFTLDKNTGSYHG